MNDLVITNNDQPVTTSLKVSEVFGKPHGDVIKSIRKLIEDLGQGKISQSFTEGTYLNQQNKSQPMYYMNRDGFTLLAMGFTGRKALQFKVAYIEAFNHMEATLHALPAQDTILNKTLELARLCSTDPELLKLLYSVTKQPDVVEQPAAEKEYIDTTDPDTITMEDLFYDYVIPTAVIKRIPKGSGKDGYSITALYQYVYQNFRDAVVRPSSGPSGIHRSECLVKQDRVEDIIESLIEYNTSDLNAQL